jgi:hypothetical protein
MKTPSDILDAQAFNKSMAQHEGVHDWSFHREMLLWILHFVVKHRVIKKQPVQPPGVLS